MLFSMMTAQFTFLPTVHEGSLRVFAKAFVFDDGLSDRCEVGCRRDVHFPDDS